MTLGNSRAGATVATSDLERARSFYVEKLGLTVVQDNAPEALLCRAGEGSDVLIYRRPDHEPGGATVLSFNVEDLPGVVGKLSNAGIEFADYDFPGLKTDENHIATLPDNTRAAWFTDPDGNIIAVGSM
jgi:catechol 2,3-dioxygenase-like lactoylglutathione lyase family enzyme